MKKRILTGIQNSGKPHLGNILGAIIPSIKLSENTNNECFYFIADLHSLTSTKDKDIRIENTYAVAAAWLAFGVDPKKSLLYRQSKSPKVCELAWYLNCFTPYPMLANAHSFKDKSEKLSEVNAGLFTYPVLMAADILLYHANVVPVGKDQVQHIEIARDIAKSFNSRMGKTFTVPELSLSENTMLVPGIDGQKMSKSYGNTIDILLPEKEVAKQINRIQTESLPVNGIKDPDTCILIKIFSLLANPGHTEIIRREYSEGKIGYGEIKRQMTMVIYGLWEHEIEKYLDLMNDKPYLEQILAEGEEKANNIANNTVEEVRARLGF